MLLSGGLPDDSDMQEILADASYILSKRSGFVQSDNYSDDHVKKRDVYLLAAGSMVSKCFKGRVLDVSCNGAHPVYRYAMPDFLGVKR